jgi:PAS domain S-box-containing protein
VGRRATPDEILSAEQFLDFFRSADVGLAILDDQLRYLALNPFLARIHGSSTESHIGKRLQEVVGGLTTQLEPAYKAVVATGRPVLKYEVKGAVSASTEAGHWIDNLFPLKDAKGRVKKVCAVVAEVPSNKKLEEILPDLSLSTVRSVLRSWKEIAEYSGACIKTVQRWEKLHRFPIRRLKASKGSVVSALKSEVDSWMRTGMPSANSKTENDPFRSLFMTSPVPTLLINDEHVVVDANIAVANLLGAERNDLVGRRLESFCKYTSANQHSGINLRHEQGRSTAFQIFSCADGTLFTADWVLQRLAHGMHSITLTNIYRDMSPPSP